MTEKSKILEQVGQNILTERKKQKLTQVELARRSLKLNNANLISAIERGTGNPKLTTLIDISNGLGVPLAELLKMPNESDSASKLDIPTINCIITFLDALKKQG